MRRLQRSRRDGGRLLYADDDLQAAQHRRAGVLAGCLPPDPHRDAGRTGIASARSLDPKPSGSPRQAACPRIACRCRPKTPATRPATVRRPQRLIAPRVLPTPLDRTPAPYHVALDLPREDGRAWLPPTRARCSGHGGRASWVFFCFFCGVKKGGPHHRKIGSPQKNRIRISFPRRMPECQRARAIRQRTKRAGQPSCCFFGSLILNDCAMPR